ncbi:hypothetical protein HHL19_35825 [Streptomyces sp. R302]|uniref:hypothetical protein n=1 Tax=unclassified Streptomyces TaxID=2593676 RepID=UPI00145D36A0|nr:MULTISPECIES: hypothetical protein [unclassified Streptomyces]NML55090.1 hypothetical protein [Streptomyces sp. R301]NML83880.1 hypothetical protein [Streptomyces sp. R302]
MHLLVAVKSWPELAEDHGEPRVIMHCKSASTAVPREQHAAYAHNIASGKTLRETGLRAVRGPGWRQHIRVAEYIEPVTGERRFALDFWTDHGKWFVADHSVLAVVEAAYYAAVRAEAQRPCIAVLPERTGLTPDAYFDLTDVA